MDETFLRVYRHAASSCKVLWLYLVSRVGTGQVPAQVTHFFSLGSQIAVCSQHSDWFMSNQCGISFFFLSVLWPTRAISCPLMSVWHYAGRYVAVAVRSTFVLLNHDNKSRLGLKGTAQDWPSLTTQVTCLIFLHRGEIFLSINQEK